MPPRWGRAASTRPARSSCTRWRSHPNDSRKRSYQPDLVHDGEPERVLEGVELARAVAGTGGTGTTNPATAFLAAVRDRTPASPALAEALPAHRVVDAVYASAAAGGAVVAPA